MKQFEILFHDLDQNMKKLKISSYGLSDTTLEEVIFALDKVLYTTLEEVVFALDKL